MMMPDPLRQNIPQSQPAEAKPDTGNSFLPSEARYGTGVPDSADSMNQRSQAEMKIIVWTACSLSSFCTYSAF